jgi:hypothetical protein
MACLFSASKYRGIKAVMNAIDFPIASEFFRGGYLGKSQNMLLLLCMKGATTHTSLHQIGPNLALN